MKNKNQYSKEISKHQSKRIEGIIDFLCSSDFERENRNILDKGLNT